LFPGALLPFCFTANNHTAPLGHSVKAAVGLLVRNRWSPSGSRAKVTDRFANGKEQHPAKISQKNKTKE
jgi:hypothetical protein